MLGTVSYPLIRKLRPFFNVVYHKYFRASIVGLENIPEDGPVLLVVNHSGLGVFEIALWTHGWYEYFGEKRELIHLAHDTLMRIAGRFLSRLGFVAASRESAQVNLRAGKVVIVAPGGDVECTRPFWEHYKVTLGERKGFVKMVLELDVPVVPMVTVGTHHHYMILYSGCWISRLLGLDKRLRITRIPIWPTLVLFGGVMILAVLRRVSPVWVPLAFCTAILPLPTKMQARLGPPIHLKESIDQIRSSGSPVEAGFELIRNAMQGMMDQLAKERKHSVQ
jgi:1-acyl-sn-glycerol-3-phosphate acyltransferase